MKKVKMSTLTLKTHVGLRVGEVWCGPVGAVCGVSETVVRGKVERREEKRGEERRDKEE